LNLIAEINLNLK